MTLFAGEVTQRRSCESRTFQKKVVTCCSAVNQSGFVRHIRINSVAGEYR